MAFIQPPSDSLAWVVKNITLRSFASVAGNKSIMSALTAPCSLSSMGYFKRKISDYEPQTKRIVVTTPFWPTRSHGKALRISGICYILSIASISIFAHAKLDHYFSLPPANAYLKLLNSSKDPFHTRGYRYQTVYYKSVKTHADLSHSSDMPNGFHFLPNRCCHLLYKVSDHSNLLSPKLAFSKNRHEKKSIGNNSIATASNKKPSFGRKKKGNSWVRRFIDWCQTKCTKLHGSSSGLRQRYSVLAIRLKSLRSSILASLDPSIFCRFMGMSIFLAFAKVASTVHQFSGFLRLVALGASAQTQKKFLNDRILEMKMQLMGTPGSSYEEILARRKLISEWSNNLKGWSRFFMIKESLRDIYGRFQVMMNFWYMILMMIFRFIESIWAGPNTNK